MAKKKVQKKVVSKRASVKKVPKKRFCWGLTFAYLLFAVGAYLLSWGLVGSYNYLLIFQSPIFWGLFLILVGAASMNSSK